MSNVLSALNFLDIWTRLTIYLIKHLEIEEILDMTKAHEQNVIFGNQVWFSLGNFRIEYCKIRQ